MAGEITLKVIEARPTDVGRGIARIDPAVFSEMGWQAGDVVSIHGKKKTAALLWPGYPEDMGTGIVRLDGNTRRNAGASIDDKVPVKIAQAAAAESVTSDYGGWYDRKEIYRLVIFYKGKTGISKKGGAHVLFRHTPASLMVQNGCDLLTIQHVLRHNDINTSMRYLHLADDTKRLKYDKFLKL